MCDSLNAENNNDGIKSLLKQNEELLALKKEKLQQERDLQESRTEEARLVLEDKKVELEIARLRQGH
jgi:hypothetical protein